MTPEGKVKAEYRALLDKLGYRFSPVNTGYGKRTLDELCCIKGRFVAIEGKRAGGEPKLFQSLIAEEIRRAGGLVFPARSLDEVVANLRNAGLI
jgi:hypothetical protein